AWVCRARGPNGRCTRTTGIVRPQEVTIVPVDFFVPGNTGRRRIQVCTAIDWRAPGALNSRNRIMQALLARQGYRMDPPDGIVGPQTRAAIAQFQLANRIRVTGLPDRRTVRALVGPWGVGDEVARNDKACVKFRLSRRGPLPPEPEYEQPSPPATTPAPIEEPDQLEVPPPPGQGPLACGPNEVPSQNGCRCKPGYRVNLNGECIRQQEATTPPPAKSEEQCTGGKFRSGRGECVCPADKKDVNGVCRRPEKPREPVSTTETAPTSPEPVTVPEPEPKSCPGNQILGTDGKCGCYLDMKTKDGKCLVKVRKDCLPGQIINIRGKCECPKGETVRDGKCARQ
ncbi:MAG: peptidoglycan-binding domain-containing protein, partial [Hyphomicrobiales bacterium]